MPKIPVKVVTWEDIVNLSTRLAEKIRDDEYNVDVIIAIARGGLVPARLVADVLGILDILSIKIEHWIVTASHTPEAKVKYPFKVDLSGKNVLIIDDITDTGDSIELAKKYVTENFRPKEVRTATLQYIKPVAKVVPDYYADEITSWTWFMYPWNYWEDEINLLNKILIEKNKQNIDINDLKNLFRESYGIEKPPIPLEDILKEMKRRKML
ncbi:phosphoribosyltransferase [Sulfolobus tengchongensis]|uniref:Phosphoribosyltransferase n=1 Tax=Sulfolobus tengchongensis TaxID=207809 RepID=A0AAX4L3E4_9CREN